MAVMPLQTIGGWTQAQDSNSMLLAASAGIPKTYHYKLGQCKVRAGSCFFLQSTIFTLFLELEALYTLIHNLITRAQGKGMAPC